MKRHDKHDHPQLHHIDEEVFADELEAIVARREAAAKRPNPLGKYPSKVQAESATALRETVAAHTDDHGHVCPEPDLDLVGLAISGGGIRSATFNLGVIQVFAKRGLLRWFDYLSTVSGGGYVGSALSSALLFETKAKDGGGDEAPFASSFVHVTGDDEPALIKHLRSGRDYLAPGGLRDMARIPAVLLRGIIINLLVVLPLIGLLAIISAVAPPFGVFYHQLEFTGFSAEQLGRGDVILENIALFFLPTLIAAALFVGWSVLFPLVAKLSPRASWARRNRFELSFSSSLLLIGVVGVVNLLPCLYYVVFNGTLEDTPPWRVTGAAVAAVLPVATSLRSAAARASSFTRSFDRLKLLAAALLGPLILLSMYLAMSRLVLTPLTVPFGATDSALNVAARALRTELELPTSAILDESADKPYTRWANQLYDTVQAADDTAIGSTDNPYYDFLATAMRSDTADLTASLRWFKRRFPGALALRRSSIGMQVFGENRFLEPLGKNLDINPATRRPYETVSADELLFADQQGADKILALIAASEELRKDLVLMHSAIVALIIGSTFLYVTLFVNINKTGLHRFYRDRLSLAYLFDPSDPDGEAGTADNLKLSDIDPVHAGNPYHLINAALNIPATDIPDLQGRASDFFMMSPRWCGSSATGYHRTSEFEKDYDRDITVATAFAISGAAASPQMGVNTSKPLALIMTLLNIRLDYWVPNLRVLQNKFGRASRVPGPTYLLREVSGQMNVKTPFVNLSDGGHIENLGLYELLRRRCKYIVVCDAEQDSDMILSSLGKLTAYARMDDGIWIDWGGTLDRFKKNAKTGYSSAHWAAGKIHYQGAEGRIIYIKSSMCGHEWPDMMAYKAKNPEFPQQSTGDQFFSEDQFEAYRALGYLIANQLFEDGAHRVDKIDEWFDQLVADAGWKDASATGRPAS